MYQNKYFHCLESASTVIAAPLFFMGWKAGHYWAFQDPLQLLLL